MAKATLNKNGIAIKAGELTVYNFDGETRELLSSSVEFLAVGVGIPANSCTDAPPENRDSYAVCRLAGLDGWEYIEDHRGETVYSTETGQAVGIIAPGALAKTVTLSAPSTPFDRWNGEGWVTDLEALRQADESQARQKKDGLLSQARTTISLWQSGLQLGIISDEDKASLMTWMTYIKALNAVDVAAAPDIDWPLMPE